MDATRRRLLRTGAAGACVLAAGCVGSNDGPESGGGSGEKGSSGEGGGSSGEKTPVVNPPEIGFEFAYTESGLSVKYQTADSVAAENLVLYCGGTTVPFPEGTLEDYGEAVVTSECSQDDDLEVRWRAPDANVEVVLAEGTAEREVRAAPQVSVDWTYSSQSGVVTAIHNGGDTLRKDQLAYACAGTRYQLSGGKVQAGETIFETTNCDPGEEVKLIWVSSKSERSTTINTYTIPS